MDTNICNALINISWEFNIPMTFHFNILNEAQCHSHWECLMQCLSAGEFVNRNNFHVVQFLQQWCSNGMTNSNDADSNNDFLLWIVFTFIEEHNNGPYAVTISLYFGKLVDKRSKMDRHKVSCVTIVCLWIM